MAASTRLGLSETLGKPKSSVSSNALPSSWSKLAAYLVQKPPKNNPVPSEKLASAIHLPTSFSSHSCLKNGSAQTFAQTRGLNFCAWTKLGEQRGNTGGRGSCRNPPWTRITGSWSIDRCQMQQQTTETPRKKASTGVPQQILKKILRAFSVD